MHRPPLPFLAVKEVLNKGDTLTLPIRHYEEVKGWIFVGQKNSYTYELGLDKQKAINIEDKWIIVLSIYTDRSLFQLI